jgi:U3 small nucleolar ribonucleoprotein protein IMP3
MSLRKLRFHERKLLRKVDFVQYKSENSVRELKVMRIYNISDREEYQKYNRMVGEIKHLASELLKLDVSDSFRIKTTDQLVEKLYNMGLIATKGSLVQCQQITASSFCRRRLPVVMVRLKMSQSVARATQLIEQGHVRVGPNVVSDPAFLVTRVMEDYVTWVASSKIRRHIATYNDTLDDFELDG